MTDPATSTDAMQPVLACEGLVAGYGDLAVVRGLDLTVEAGEVVALLGPNGAGKTTILMTIAGLLRPLAGRVLLDGREPPAAPHLVARAGVSHVPDDRALFGSLSVRDNLDLARAPGGMSLDEVLDFFPGLRRRLKLRAAMLSGGEQQMLAIGRAMVQGPRLLLVDEMSMGLAPTIVRSILPVLRQLADERAVAVLMVEQHVHLAIGIADRVDVLVHGDLVLRVPASEVRDDRTKLEKAYLGAHGTPTPSA